MQYWLWLGLLLLQCTFEGLNWMLNLPRVQSWRAARLLLLQALLGMQGHCQVARPDLLTLQCCFVSASVAQVVGRCAQPLIQAHVELTSPNSSMTTQTVIFSAIVSCLHPICHQHRAACSQW